MGYQYYWLAKKQAEISKTEVVQTTASKAKTAKDETAGWKTYRNDEYGFEMKYPSQFIIKNTLQPKGKWGLPSNRLSLENNLIKENPRLILLINSEGFGPFFADTVYTIRKIQNKIEIVDINNGKIRDGINIIQTKPAKLGNHNYLFLFSFNEGGKDFTSIFDKMLSTFRFTK